MDQFKCKAIFLTSEEADKPKNCGYKFVKNNISRAVPIPCEIGDRIYDKGCTRLVYEDKAYEPYRDFIMVETGDRYYLCKPSTMAFDYLD